MVVELLRIERRVGAEGRALVQLSGRCDLGQAQRLWSELQAELGRAEPFDLDLSGLEELDGAGAALLQAVRAQAARAGAAIELTGVAVEQARMLALNDCERGQPCAAAEPRRLGFLDEIGRAASGISLSLLDVFAFVGDLTHSMRRTLRDTRSVNWRALPGLMEGAGADGVPIVLLINFLVGLIIGLQAAFQLERFGANIFIADLVGLSMVREMAPLMTAIVVAGRSGAAYAAELGTMRVNQEVDALRTLGFDPQRFLVLPRLVALAIVVPMLTALSMVVGIFGGQIVAVQRLGLTTLAYFVELQKALSFADVAGGLFKSFVFALTIVLISCQRGLATRGGAAGVGRSTTSAVVVTLFFLVVLDALFTFFFNVFGI
jgi:phospholipid/cholesterol/gamma-HCH transport system permease protein